MPYVVAGMGLVGGEDVLGGDRGFIGADRLASVPGSGCVPSQLYVRTPPFCWCCHWNVRTPRVVDDHLTRLWGQ